MANKQRKESRRQEIKHRKSFLPAILLTIFLWIATGGILFFIDPASIGALPLFFLFLFLSLIFTFSLLLANTRRGFFVTLVLVVFIFLRYLGVGTILNLLLLIGAVGTFEFYITKNT